MNKITTKSFMLISLIVLTQNISACSGSGGQASSTVNVGTASLQNTFNVVETFDELQDWDGNARTGYNYGTTYAPKEADGSSSKWVYFTNDRITIEYSAPTGSFAVGDTITGVTSGATGKVEKLNLDNGKTYLQLMTPLSGRFVAGETIRNQASVTAKFSAYPKWIANHGSDYVWGGTGKSLRINYNDFSGGIAGFGPSRLGLFLGDGITGKSGYKKVHMFMMVKFQPGFFKQNTDGTFLSVGTLKFVDLCSGFTAPDYWGNATEHASTNGSAQMNTEYGPNSTVFNIFGGGASTPNRLFFREYTDVASWTGTAWTYTGTSYTARRLTNDTTKDNDINSYYLANEWFGLEVAADIGTVGKNDGSMDFWVYDKTGKEVGHFTSVGENRLVQFDHFYNKIVLGGNRICTGYGTCPEGQDNRWYADDFIIHNDRIGPKYFNIKLRQ